MVPSPSGILPWGGGRKAEPHHCLSKPHLLAQTFPCLPHVFHPSLLSCFLIFLLQVQMLLIFSPCLLSEAQTCRGRALLLNWKWYLFFLAIIRLTVWIEPPHVFPIFITWHTHVFFFVFFAFPLYFCCFFLSLDVCVSIFTAHFYSSSHLSALCSTLEVIWGNV